MRRISVIGVGGSGKTVLANRLAERLGLPVGIIRRRMRYRGGQHDSHGVYDRITPGFVRYILGYRRQMRPRVEQLIAEHGDHAAVHVFRSRRAADRWLATVEPHEPA